MVTNVFKDDTKDISKVKVPEELVKEIVAIRKRKEVENEKKKIKSKSA